MEATALSVGKSVLNGALGYAKSAFAEEVALQLGIQRDHAFVSDELEMMQSFMMEAHEERNDNKVVKIWVKQVRDTAYDVEDSLQDFAVRVERPSWWRFPRTLLERRRVAKKMKELRAKVEDVSQRNVRYRLIKGSGSKATAATVQSSIIAAAIFGVDDARRAAKENQRVDLVQLINKEDDDLRVIAVWGTGGDIGQTSIIRAAYKNPDTQRKFPSRAWVRVTHPFSSEGFVRSLVNQFLAVEGFKDILDTEKTAHDLVQEFDGYVKEKRFLIVLTDLCTIEEWDQIEKCLPNNNKGSRIIVSTTQVEVASLCAGQDSQASELKQLSADHTLYAFYDKGSQNEMVSMDPVSNSDVATTSTNAQTVAPSEITENQCKDVDEMKVDKKSLTRIRTGVGSFEESQLIGREKEISKIIGLISNKASQQSQVISVWGMGGLGKTTLANGIYQSPKLSDMFEKHAFVTIMRPFNPADLLRSLVGRLQEESSKKEELLNNRPSKTESLAMMGVEALTKELKRLLEKKSCLIVLDDLSSIEEWDHIIQGFSWMEKTTRIIVTTREESIAKHCSGKYGIVHNLEVLKEEDALNLFSLKNPELFEETKKILKKCGGLPLAIVTIGGYLASRPKTRAEWRKLNENISAELEMNPELGMIRTVLQTSYDGLPYELKSCFLYLSIFPEDHIISQRRLVRRWTAEGYSHERRGKSANEMAENYFTELKYRSMILPVQKSVCSRKSIDSCKVHDLIREIAISKSMEENLVFRLEEGCGLSTHGAIRHLAISSNWKGDQSELERIVDLSRLRSLTIFGGFRPFYISDKMRLLRVLDLEGIWLEYHQLDHIWKLLHLKYLSLRGCIGIDLLPDSLGNLRQLQVLDVRGTNVMALPKTIIKLRKLQYIHAGWKISYVIEEKDSLTRRCLWGAGQCATCCVPVLGDIDGPLHKALTRRDACTFACCVRFPAVMMGFVEESGAMVPRGTRKLKELHTLREVNVGRGNAVLQDIKMLTGLRKLGVTGINRKNGPVFRAAISKLSRLESLSVSSSGKPGLHGCLDAISPPPENLQSLKLYGNTETLPQWIKLLPHLVKLKLVSTRLLEHDDAMEFLGKLSKLEILSLSRQSFQGEELRFRSQQTGRAFGSLRVLMLTNIRYIKSVKFEEGIMPKLERLQVRGVVNNEIGFSGLDILQSINEVQLSVYIPWDKERIIAAKDPKTREKIEEEERQEQRRKKGELKKKVQEQLARNRNEPILTFDNIYLG
uniref:NB-ARC domain-containing protein n=1 Tax=Setaria italica TaxID=4555 RepID=K3ZNR1_SETIT